MWAAYVPAVVSACAVSRCYNNTAIMRTGGEAVPDIVNSRGQYPVRAESAYVN